MTPEYNKHDPLPDTVQPGGILEGVQICPVGKWPKDGLIQDCSPANLQKVCDNSLNEILVDFEHNAETGGDTTAAAWITNLRVDPERGLVGDFKFTDVGAEAVAQRRLRFLSPAFSSNCSGEKEYAPTRLVSVALTNKPNIPVSCVLNRESPESVNVEDKSRNPNMDKLKDLLGLAPEATDEDVVAAVTALKEEVATLNSEKEEAEAEAFAEENKNILNKEGAKKAYLLNKDVARALAASVVCKAPAKTSQVILNTGSVMPAVGGFSGDARKELASLPPSERAAFYKAHKNEVDN